LPKPMLYNRGGKEMMNNVPPCSRRTNEVKYKK
jgi:hypothetical protein